MTVAEILALAKDSDALFALWVVVGGGLLVVGVRLLIYSLRYIGRDYYEGRRP